MTLSITHPYSSTVNDNATPGEVGPDEWNANHTITMATGKYVGRATSGSGAAEELTQNFFNARDYGWIPDGTDRSVAALALLDTVEAAGGGTIFFPPSTLAYRADSQLRIPDDSDPTQPHQVNFAFVGAGSGPNWYANPTQEVGPQCSILDLRYNGADGGRIESRGVGSLTIRGLQIKDGSSTPGGAPLVKSTNTTLSIRENTFVGAGGKSSTVTITAANPGVVSWTAHGLQRNNTVVFSTTGALPSGLTAGTIYYVLSSGLATDSFRVAATPGGTAIDTSGGGASGTHTAAFGGVDAIVLGGEGDTLGGDVNSIFQGYGTVVEGNIFTYLNRGVFGLSTANSIVVVNNSWIHNTGTVLVESNGSGVDAAFRSGGWYIANNLFEMDVAKFGVKLVATGFCNLGPNSMWDTGVNCISYYRLETGPNAGTQLSTGNVIFNQLVNAPSNPTGTLVTQSGAASQLSRTTIVGAHSHTPSTGFTGVAGNEAAFGLLVKGTAPDTTKQYPGQLIIIDHDDTAGKQLSLGHSTSTNIASIDAYNLALAAPNVIKINPRGGAVQTGANLRASKTTDYTVTVADSGTHFDNVGASSTVVFTLPTDPTVSAAAGGVAYGFTVGAGQRLRVTASALATINNGGTVTGAGGNISSTLVGSYLQLTNYDTSNGRLWVAKSITGTWAMTT